MQDCIIELSGFDVLFLNFFRKHAGHIFLL